MLKSLARGGYFKMKFSGCAGALVFCLLFSQTSFAEAKPDYRLEITSQGLSESDSNTLTQLAMGRADVQKELFGARFHVLRSHFAKGRDGAYELLVYDYTHDRLLKVSQTSEFLFGITTLPQAANAELALRPSEEEFDDAVSILKNDSALGPRLASEELRAYRAMPGVLPMERVSGRVITVGVMSDSHEHEVAVNEVVAVDLIGMKVLRFPLGYPATSYATREVCGPYSAGGSTTAAGTPGEARVLVKNGAQTVWEMVVTRPSASDGYWGSGVELTNVKYLGQEILARANLPIFNVRYINNACGPYRDWSWQEGNFRASGDLIASGIMQTTTEAQTILESGQDGGNFKGVAVFLRDGEAILKSQLEAGWYRYVSEWHFHPDGTIEPRFGFSAVQDSCTCNLYVHHAYWRFNFALGGDSRSRVEAYNGVKWNLISNEEREIRDAAHQRLRITSPAGLSYELDPGENDGTADDYGAGDQWVVHNHDVEMDDSQVYAGTHANIDAFVNGESVVDQDLTLWYGAHFIHNTHDHNEIPHIAGPSFRPLYWGTR